MGGDIGLANADEMTVTFSVEAAALASAQMLRWPDGIERLRHAILRGISKWLA
jgi:hypothetical protein